MLGQHGSMRLTCDALRLCARSGSAGISSSMPARPCRSACGCLRSVSNWQGRLQDSDASRTRLQPCGWLRRSGLLPLPRQGSSRPPRACYAIPYKGIRSYASGHGWEGWPLQSWPSAGEAPMAPPVWACACGCTPQIFPIFSWHRFLTLLGGDV